MGRSEHHAAKLSFPNQLHGDQQCRLWATNITSTDKGEGWLRNKVQQSESLLRQSQFPLPCYMALETKPQTFLYFNSHEGMELLTHFSGSSKFPWSTWDLDLSKSKLSMFSTFVVSLRSLQHLFTCRVKINVHEITFSYLFSNQMVTLELLFRVLIQ